MINTGPGLEIPLTVLTYDVVITEHGCADIAANIRAGNTFSVPFLIDSEDRASLTATPENNFSAKGITNMVMVSSLRFEAWAVDGPIQATVYGQPYVLEYVTLGRSANAQGEPVYSSTITFQGGCTVAAGPQASELSGLRPA